MKKYNCPLILLVFSVLIPGIISAQISPFKLSSKWYFGNFAGLDFSSGNPAVLTGGRVDSWGQEGSSTITDANGDVVFYTDGYELYDGNHNFIQIVRGGTSSTQNSVAIPDPASPDTRYYLFTANVEPSSGGQRVGAVSELGINYYHIEKTGASVSVIAGPVQIAGPAEVSEQLCAGTDLQGNYWVVAHQGGDWAGWNMRNINSWNVTSAGVSTRVSSSVATATGNNPWLGSMKINKCQTKLGAVYATGVVEIYEWDANTGKVTNLIQRIEGFPALYGCEFSSDGSMFYFTSSTADKLYQLEVATGTVYSDASWKSMNNTPWMGTLQLGPDGKIYVTNGNHAGSPGGTPSYIGVINDPSVSGAGCNYDGKGFLLNAGPAIHPNIERGIANIAWLAPKCNMDVVDNCPHYAFSYNVKNHFNEGVSIIAGSEEWNFDEGNGFETGLGSSPFHDFNRGGMHAVKLRFKDQTCNRTWELNKVINVNCVLPVTWLSFEGENKGSYNFLRWSTSSELNNREFIIERSVDGDNYETIGSVTGNGNSSSPISYEFKDWHPLISGTYYRIRQVDNNGMHEFSPVIWVENSIVNIHVFPNPSSADFTLKIPDGSNVKVFVLDALGREVYLAETQSELSFGSSLSAGCYTVKVVSETMVWSSKVIKER